jgi:hypothetical protein
MSLAAVVTVVLVGLLVAALAFYLLWVVVILRRLTDTLGKVVFGVRAIAHRLAPLDEVVTQVNTDLTVVADAVEDFASRLNQPGDAAGRAS